MVKKHEQSVCPIQARARKPRGLFIGFWRKA